MNPLALPDLDGFSAPLQSPLKSSIIPLSYFQDLNMAKTLYLIDFDGTITNRDTLDTLAEKYYPEEAKQWTRDIMAGIINVTGWLRAFEKQFNIPLETYNETLNEISIDPTFAAFIAGRDVRIVSGGFAYNIHEIFKNHKLTPPKVYANDLFFLENNRIKIDFPYFNPECGKCGVCKSKILLQYRDRYDEIVYIGDGITDLCAAEKSDKIYAKSGRHLSKWLTEHNIPFNLFNDFGDILQMEEMEEHE